MRVVCLDNLLTGRSQNLRQFEREPRFDFVEADVIDPLPESLLKARFDRIYNLACPASPRHYQANPEHTLLSNVVGTRQLLRLAEDHKARFLLASTSEVYGEPERHPQDETCRGQVNCTGPRACYDEGKRSAEALSFDFYRAGRADVRVVRIFNTYGSRMRPDDGRVISNIICQALRGDEITVYGDGGQTRSFCYVTDLVEGLEKMMAFEGPQPGPINLGNPHELNIAELVRMVTSMIVTVSPVVHRQLPQDDPSRRKPDIAKAAGVLSWSPKTRLEDGLAATIAYFVEELANEDDEVTAGAELIAAE